ncbi:MAG: TRAP transporter small permease subunit [Tistlia sp.]|uniref:TRAP transporter small permease n=1 Tax=Tistlia sp. TaxID=3057121 RepID=UPI0034A5BD6F
MSLWRSASDALDRLVVAICIGCILVMLTISFVGFLYMMTTGAALSWTYSLARLFLPWIGLLSITIAFKNGEHVAMAILLNRLPPRAGRLVGWSIVGLIGLFGALMLWQGAIYFLESTQIFMVSDRFQVSHRWVAASVPISGLVLLIHLVDGLALLEGPQESDGTLEQLVPEADDHPHLRESR